MLMPFNLPGISETKRYGTNHYKQSGDTTQITVTTHMGRYYNGDIEGKFWFAIQDSNAADRFGVTGEPPNTLQYYFSEDDLDSVNAEINKIKENLGFKLVVIEKFFQDNLGWNEEMLAKAHITTQELSEYADLQLGIKIRDSIVDIGQCSFEAEC